MPEGLNLIVGADVTQAEAALKSFVTTAEQSAVQASAGITKGLAPATQAIAKIPAAAKTAIAGVSKLGDTVETLRAKLLAKKDFLVTEKDIAKIAIYNKEIRALEIEIIRVQNAGKEGFSDIGTAVVKSSGALGGFTTVAKKSFSALRLAANIIPGIGIAGILGGAVEFFSGLITGAEKANNAVTSLLQNVNNIAAEAGAGAAGEISKVSALASVVQDQTKSYELRNRALTELKEINKGYFGDLTLEAASLVVLKDRVNEYANALIAAAVIKEFQDQIGKVSVELSKQTAAAGKAAGVLGTYQRKAAAAAKSNKDLTISGGTAPGTALNVSDITNDQNVKDATNALNKQFGVVQSLQGQYGQLKTAINKAILESLKFRDLDPKGGDGGGKSQENKLQAVINKAKQLADFLDKTTIRSFRFEVDPRETLKETYDKAIKFIEAATNRPRSFELKQTFFTLPAAPFAKVEKAFKDFENDVPKLTKELTDLIQEQFNRHPILVQFRRMVTDMQGQEVERANRAGVSIPGLNAPESLLKRVERQSIATSNAIRDVLTPAFQDLFGAILKGESPIKAFLQGLGNAVTQLIQKLIAAAIQAALLSALFPAGLGSGKNAVKGFGGFFKNILGFAAGGIVSGPTLALVGEGRGTSRSNPEVIAPLDQLRGMLEGMGGSGSQVVVLSPRLRGQDITYSQARTSRRNGRLGG